MKRPMTAEGMAADLLNQWSNAAAEMAMERGERYGDKMFANVSAGTDFIGDRLCDELDSHPGIVRADVVKALAKLAPGIARKLRKEAV